MYDSDSLPCPGLSPERAEALLRRLGAGVAEKHTRVEGLGWQAEIEPTEDGVVVHFHAHDEILDDLLRRFEQHVDREMGGD